MDGTKVPWDKELKYRAQRDLLIKDTLQRGVPVAYRSTGSSLSPIVKSGELCFYDPVNAGSKIIQGDIVFCEVQPLYWKPAWLETGGMRLGVFYAHLVKKIEVGGNGKQIYFIGPVRDHLNGWCFFEHIYGRFRKSVG